MCQMGAGTGFSKTAFAIVEPPFSAELAPLGNAPPRSPRIRSVNPLRQAI